MATEAEIVLEDDYNYIVVTEQPARLYGLWCFDCQAPMLRPDYSQACRDAERAGWQVIRGVNRCPDCAAADRAAQAHTAAMAADINRRLHARETLTWTRDKGGTLWPSGVHVSDEAIREADRLRWRAPDAGLRAGAGEGRDG